MNNAQQKGSGQPNDALTKRLSENIDVLTAAYQLGSGVRPRSGSQQKEQPKD